MNIISILVWAVIGYIAFVLASLVFPYPFPTVIGLLVFVAGAFGGGYIGGRRL